MSTNFVYVTIRVVGCADVLAHFTDTHIKNGKFDPNTIIPMPVDLDFEFNSLAETGFDAQYGDWRKVAGLWMLKEPAKKLGYRFPFESRGHVIECLNTLDCANLYFDPSNIFKRNLDTYGYGSYETWRKDNWGTGGNIDDIRLAYSDDAIEIKFICNSYPQKLLKQMSLLNPNATVEVSYKDDEKKKEHYVSLRRGRIEKKPNQ